MQLHNALFLLLSAAFYIAPTAVAASDVGSPAKAVARSKMTGTHYLPDDYSFDKRDGWNHVNATDLSYKYRRDIGDKNPLERRGGLLGDTLGKIFKGLKAFGKPETVKITWYTGEDLNNPSCWANGDWAPTDKSYGCALTLDGWENKPKCFAFQEICNGKKCTYVRVIDTCGGCDVGSHHVDLTKAAFESIADPDVGVLQAHMRGVHSKPDVWDLDLFGPEKGDD